MDTRRITGIAGVAAALVFALGNALWAFDQPSAGTGGPEIVAFYTDHATGIVAGGALSLLAIAIFVLFAAGLRTILREVEGNDVLADAAFGGALLIAATGLGAETINGSAALRAHAGDLTPALGRAMFEISYVFGYYAAGVGIGILLIAVSAAALRTGSLLPRWLALVGIVAGIAFMTPLVQWLLVPMLPAFAILAAGLLRQRPG